MICRRHLLFLLKWNVTKMETINAYEMLIAKPLEHQQFRRLRKLGDKSMIRETGCEGKSRWNWFILGM